MENRMKQRFGLPTAISMVVGIVIGSGVFFKAVKVLQATGGSMLNSLLVIGIVGLICIICSCVFATMGTKYSKCNGIIDYAEVALGPTFGYYMGWFMSTMYYPILSSTLAYISAMYTCTLLGLPSFGQAHLALAMLFMLIGIGINSLAPQLAGKLQVSMMVIKLIPLCIMGVAGVIVGLINGNGIAIFRDASYISSTSSSGMLTAVCAFAFAYEGWIIATTINSELKNPKRDLPRALIGGAIFCTVVYMLYTYAMSATMNAAQIIEAGDDLPRQAFSNLFHSNVAGTIVSVLIIISCLGTMNGLIMGCMRGLYSVSIRGKGPLAHKVSEVDSSTGMPMKSCVLGMMLCGFWLFQCSTLFFNGPLVTGSTGNPEWLMAWEGDEIVIITQYALYIPIFLHLIFREKEFNFFRRFVLPILGLASCLFMCYCCWEAYQVQVLYYLSVFALIMLAGFFVRYFDRKKAALLQASGDAETGAQAKVAADDAAEAAASHE